MLYTEEGLYLEWKVVSSRIHKKSCNSHNKLVWMALQPVLLGFRFILHREPAALPFFYFCMQVPSL